MKESLPILLANQLSLSFLGAQNLKVLTLNIKTHGTLVLHGTKQLALVYRVYYKCMRTNMSVGALDKGGNSWFPLIESSYNMLVLMHL